MALAPLFSSRVAVAAPAAALEPLLQGLVDRGRAAWPAISLPAERFVVHAAERLADAEAPLDALATLHAEDLYLACACAAGDPVALAALEPSLAAAEAWVRRRARLSSPAEDVRQLLRERLLVATPRATPPRIAGYSGRGPLSSWLRVAALRIVLNVNRGEREAPALAAPDALASLVLASSPELALFKARHREDFKEAFRTALAGLTVEQRNVLRLHFLEGATGDELARLYGVARRTVHRWIEQGRSSIYETMRRELTRRLAIPAEELDAALALLRSALASTAGGFLGERPDEG